MINLKQCFFITDQTNNPRAHFITDQTSNPRAHDLNICQNFKGTIGYQETFATKYLASST